MEKLQDKVFKLLVSMVVAFSVLVPNVIAKAEDSIIIVESSKESVKAGENIDITIKLNPKYNLSSMNLALSYDNNSFSLKTNGNTGRVEYTTYTQLADDIFVNNPSANVIKAAFAKARALPMPSDNRLFTISFTALDNIDAVGIKKFTMLIESATAEDNSNITEKVQSETKDATVKIDVPTTSINLNKTAATLEKDATLQLNATKNPSHTTNDEAILWTSSDETIASVDQNGLVKAKQNGLVTITAKLGSLTATCEVKVVTKQTGVKILDIENSDKITKGTSKLYKVKIEPEDTTDIPEIKWSSSNNSVATIDNTGVVKAINEGTATISASAGGYTDSFELTVNKIDITSITLDKSTASFYEKDTFALNATILPEDTTEDKTLTWSSSDDNVVKVVASQDTKSAVLTGLKKGTAKITVSSTNGKTAICTIAVKKKVTGIEIKGARDLIKNETLNLTATKIPADSDDELDKVTWKSSDESVATVDSNGKVTAKKEGSVTFSASAIYEGKTITGTAAINISEIHITKVTVLKDDSDVSQKEISINKGSKLTLATLYKPQNTTDDKTVTWKSKDTKVATVTTEGVVTALNPGKVQITATIAGVSEYVVLDVKSALTGIELSSNAIIMDKDAKKTLTVKYIPGDTTDSKLVTWESTKPEVATVDENGVVEALSKGTTTIIAKVGSFKAESIVTVNVPLKSISIASEDLEMKKGDSPITISYNENPTDHNDEISNVRWTSSDDSIVKVEKDKNNNGVITPLKKGTVTITLVVSARGKEIKDTIEVAVDEIHIKKVNLSYTELNMNKGETKDGPAVSWEPVNTTDDTDITYRSEDTKIATVDKVGKITAVAGGSTNIIVSVAGKEAKVNVKVNVPLSGIKAHTDKKEILKGETATISYNKTPSDSNDEIASVKYEVVNDTDGIASVDAKGIVTGLKEGTAIVKVSLATESSSFSDTVNVGVNEIHITSVKLNENEILLKEGENFQLEATWTPSNTTDDITASWTSSNENIVNVDNKGLVSFVSAGKATINVNIAGKTASCDVIAYVAPKLEFIKEEGTPSITLDTESLNLIVPDLNKHFATEIENGEEITVKLILSSIAEDDKTDYAALLAGSSIKEYTIGDLFNISVIAYPTNNPEKNVELTELSNGLVYTMDIPSKLLKDGRSFKISRFHDKTVEEVPSISADGTKLMFKSSKYSSFAIVYMDKEVGNNPAGDKTNPETGDTTNTSIWIIGLIVSLGAILLTHKKLRGNK